MARDQSIGIVLREQQAEWTALQSGKGRLVAVGSGRVALPVSPSVVSDEERAAAEKEKALVLKSLAGRLQGNVSAVLPSRHVLLRVVELPTIVDAELQDMVSLQVDKFSPFPTESLAVSHEVLSRGTESSIVLIAICQKPVVHVLEKTLCEAGMPASRMDVAALGWYRLLKDAGEVPETGRHMVLILDGTVPEIILFEDGIARLFRSLPGLEDLQGEELFEEVVSEVRFSLLSLNLAKGDLSGCAIVLWYTGDEPSALAGRLAGELAHIVSMKPLSGLPALSEGIARRGASRTGLVDLTPAEWLATRQARHMKKRMLWALLGIFGVWVVALGAVEGWIRIEKMSLNRLKSQQESLAGPAEEVREMRRRVLIVKRYMNQPDSALESLREISVLMPAGVELRSFTYRRDEGIKIAGESSTVNQVYDFKTALDASRMFAGATLNGPRIEPRSGRQVFDIDLTLRVVE